MKFLYGCLISALLICACEKIDVLLPSFEVKPLQQTYHVNDTVTFQFEGSADNIVFYSGEPKSRYASAGQLTEEYGTVGLEFTTATAGGKQDNSLRFMYTTDAITADNVTSANWVDITDQITLATTTLATSSGLIDLSDLAHQKVPITFGFKYKTNTPVSSAQPIWAIRAFNINAQYPDGSLLAVGTIANTLWTAYDLANPDAFWTIASSQVRIDGGPKSTPGNEDWVVTHAIDLKGSKQSVDRGLSIQSVGSNRLQEYQHIYTGPGTYTVTFVAFNNSIDDQKSVVKEFEITILPE